MEGLKQEIGHKVLFAFLQSIASRDAGRKVVAGDEKEEVIKR